MSDLHYVVRQPKKAIENPPLLILLHGYGSNELDLFSFSEELPDSLLIVSVRAPYGLSFGGYAWYAINLDASNAKFSDLGQARTSMEKVAAFIDEVKVKFNTDTNNTFLLGFSQGAILSYAISLNYPNKVQHVLALSGYINEDLIPENVSEVDITTDYYSSHGIMDQVLPVQLGRKASEILKQYKLSHVHSEYPTGHGVTPQNFYSFKTWIEERL